MAITDELDPYADPPPGEVPAPEEAALAPPPAYWPPPAYGYAPYPVVWWRPPLNGMAVASLILGIGGMLGLSVFGAVPAVILGHFARSHIRRTGERGAGMAMAGLILGYISAAGAALVVLGWIADLVVLVAILIANRR